MYELTVPLDAIKRLTVEREEIARTNAEALALKKKAGNAPSAGRLQR